MAADRLASRLTDQDRETITVAVRRAVETSPRDRSDRSALARIAYRSIGCTRPDLRDSELCEIDKIVAGEASSS